MKLRTKLTDIKSEMGKVTLTFETSASPAEIEKYLDTDLEMEIKKYRKHRSIDANKFFWAQISKLADALNFSKWDMYLMELSKYGQSVNIKVREEALPSLKRHWREILVTGDETVKETVTDEVSGYPIEKDVSYKYVNCIFGSHTYNSKEFSVLIDGVIQDMKDLNLDIPPSEDMKRIIEQMEEKERKNNDVRL